MKLNLGAGGRLMSGAVNVDRVALPGIDQVWDLDMPVWPVGTGSVEAVHARDVFEHVSDPVVFMTECHRILIDGGILWIRTPNIALSLGDAFTDPTHKRFPTYDTFNYWIPGTRHYAEHNKAYGGVAFQLSDRRPDDGSMIVVLSKMAAESDPAGSGLT